jgi:lipid-binding SYLF domain-containing protein
MLIRFAVKLLIIACISQVTTTPVAADDARKAADQAEKAAVVFEEIMSAPDNNLPQTALDGAFCVAVFPKVIKAGFIFGGRYGRGVASCRTKSGWSAPAFFNLGGGSFGLQIGGQATDFVLLFMNEKDDEGLTSLLKNKFELGGEASAAAGPLGREAGASTDLYLNAKILSYSRSKGVFAGIELKGAVISQDDDAMKAIYGRDPDATKILRGENPTPQLVAVYPRKLAQYSKSKK